MIQIIKNPATPPKPPPRNNNETIPEPEPLQS